MKNLRTRRTIRQYSNRPVDDGLLGRLIDMYHGPSLRLKRLHVILVFSALLYCVSGSMLFIYERTSNWIAFLLAGLVVQIYASWMIEREQQKNKN